MNTETVVIVIEVKSDHPAQGKTHRIARVVDAALAEMDLTQDDIVLSPLTDLYTHLKHLPEMNAKEHLDPNLVTYKVTVMHSG